MSDKVKLDIRTFIKGDDIGESDQVLDRDLGLESKYTQGSYTPTEVIDLDFATYNLTGKTYSIEEDPLKTQNQHTGLFLETNWLDDHREKFIASDDGTCPSCCVYKLAIIEVNAPLVGGMIENIIQAKGNSINNNC